MSITNHLYKSKRDLEALIENNVLENKELEYKCYEFVDGKISTKHKDKLMKEISAFANTNGGAIIIGIQEDENRMPTKLIGTGISIKEFDDWLSSFRQLVLSRIRPHLHGVDCMPIELDNDGLAIVITIPRSYSRPHSFWDGNKDEFFMRYSNGVSYMDIDDLRNGFLYSNSLQSQIRLFQKDRISTILANECVGDLGNDAKLVFHIIPQWSMELGNAVDLKEVENNSSILEPISGSGWDYRYNADGFCSYSECHESKAIDTYVQVFHNGIIEAVEIRLFSRYQEREVYQWHATQNGVLDAVKNYCQLLEMLRIPKPWHMSASILNAKGYNTSRGWGASSNVIDRNIVNSLDGILTEGATIESSIKPIFDSLSNAFGMRGSSLFG